VTPGRVRERIVADRIAWIRRMLAGLTELPLAAEADFLADARNPAAAESYLRRALEGLLDLGRHLLAKGLGVAAVEYKAIAEELARAGVIDRELAVLLRDMAGYRNRMVHFYDEVAPAELYRIGLRAPVDIERIIAAVLAWLDAHPERVERS